MTYLLFPPARGTCAPPFTVRAKDEQKPKATTQLWVLEYSATVTSPAHLLSSCLRHIDSDDKNEAALSSLVVINREQLSTEVG